MIKDFPFFQSSLKIRTFRSSSRRQSHVRVVSVERRSERSSFARVDAEKVGIGGVDQRKESGWGHLEFNIICLKLKTT